MSFIRFRIFSLSSRCLLQNFNMIKYDPSNFKSLSILSVVPELYPKFEKKIVQNVKLNCLFNFESKRFMAKSKDRKKESKKGGGLDLPKVILNDEEMQKVFEYEGLQDQIEIIIDNYKADLKDNFNIRLNPRQIEGISISYDGMSVTIADIVSVTRKQNDLILNLQSIPHMVKPVMTALVQSGLNLNPQVDGHMIFISMPKITTEHREALIKSVRQLAIKTKEKMKDRNMHSRFLQDEQKKLSKDLINNAHANLNYYIMKKSKIIDEIAAQKIDSLSK